MAKKRTESTPEQDNNSWATLKRSLQDVVLERRPERFNHYGADTGEYEPTELNQIRFMVALSMVQGMLAGYDLIGAIYEDVDAIYEDPQHFSAEQALRDFRELEIMLEDVSDLAGTLPQSDRLKDIQVALCMIDLGQTDFPAESAMLDGHEEAAIEMLQEAAHAVYEHVGYRLSQLGAEYGVHECWPVERASTGTVPLTFRARIIREKLESLKPTEAMKLPELQDWYETQAELPQNAPKTLDEGTWKRVRKELLQCGLKNSRGRGYFIQK